jgi:sialate O-acetylesterase
MRPLTHAILSLTLFVMNGLPSSDPTHASFSMAERHGLSASEGLDAPLITLPPLFSDHMVIQHGRETRIWGIAAPLADLTVVIEPETMLADGSAAEAAAGAVGAAVGKDGGGLEGAAATRLTATAAEDGTWEAVLPAYRPGGPYRIRIFADSSASAEHAWQMRDVMFGEVWIAGGQSNMEWKLNWGVDRQTEEIEDSRYPDIRFFEVPNRVSAMPLAELAGSADGPAWRVSSPGTVGEFSAVAWFFAKQAHLETGVPIGILDSNWGGTPAEAWTPAAALLDLPTYEAAARDVMDPAADWQQRMDANAAREQDKFMRIPDREGSRRTYESKVMPLFGMTAHSGGADGSVGASDADPVSLRSQGFVLANLPTGEEPLGDFAWVVKEVVLPAAGDDGGADDGGDTADGGVSADGGRLFIDHVMQEAMIFVNGAFVAEKTWMQTAVDLQLPEGLLKPGRNIVTLRVANSWDNRVWIGKPDRMWIQAPWQAEVDEGKGQDVTEVPPGRISLEGPWWYANTLEPPMPEVVRYEWTSSFLYNGMIHPLTKYAVRGAIWYQGEGNTGLPGAYRDLMGTLIGSWRSAWEQPDMPFLFVQLANYMARRDEPMESAWAELREAQLKTLELPATGMAVAIDIGEAEDIHPRNKQDVGRRLWLQARKVAFGEAVLADGPVFESMRQEGGCLIVRFDSVGDGLVSDEGVRVSGFEVAADDGIFRRALGLIQDAGSVRVCSDDVASPVHLRYGWADNPHVTLRNSAGLPASPFRTGR